MVNDQDFAKLTGGQDKGGGDWTTSNTVIEFDVLRIAFIEYSSSNLNFKALITLFWND